MKKNKPLTISKGCYGYINQRKKRHLIYTILEFAVVFGIFFLGIAILKTKNSIFSVAAVLTTLPATKMAISYIILIDKKSPDEAIYKSLCQIAKPSEILSDLIFSSPEKLMPVDFLIASQGKVLLFVSNPKADLKKTTDYVKGLVQKDYHCKSFQIYTDAEKYIANVKNAMNLNETKDEKKIINQLYKNLLPFCV